MSSADDSKARSTNQLPTQKPMDQWSTWEKLALSTSVQKSGDQNWSSVSRPLKAFGEKGRPADWFSQKLCAVQYSHLIEMVEVSKRKRGERGEETAQDIIVKKLTNEMKSELEMQLKATVDQFCDTKKRLDLLKSKNYDQETFKKLCQEVHKKELMKQAEKKNHDIFLAKRQQEMALMNRRAPSYTKAKIVTTAPTAPVTSITETEPTAKIVVVDSPVQGEVQNKPNSVETMEPLVKEELADPIVADKSIQPSEPMETDKPSQVEVESADKEIIVEEVIVLSKEKDLPSIKSPSYVPQEIKIEPADSIVEAAPTPPSIIEPEPVSIQSTEDSSVEPENSNDTVEERFFDAITIPSGAKIKEEEVEEEKEKEQETELKQDTVRVVPEEYHDSVDVAVDKIVVSESPVVETITEEKVEEKVVVPTEVAETVEIESKTAVESSDRSLRRNRRRSVGTSTSSNAVPTGIGGMTRTTRSSVSRPAAGLNTDLADVPSPQPSIEGKEVKIEEVSKSRSSSIDDMLLVPCCSKSLMTPAMPSQPATPSMTAGTSAENTMDDESNDTPSIITDVSTSEEEYNKFKKFAKKMLTDLQGDYNKNLIAPPLPGTAVSKDYSSSILWKMDLVMVKKRVESGITKTKAELKRDLLSIFGNMTLLYQEGDPITSRIKDLWQTVLDRLEPHSSKTKRDRNQRTPEAPGSSVSLPGRRKTRGSTSNENAMAAAANATSGKKLTKRKI